MELILEVKQQQRGKTLKIAPCSQCGEPTPCINRTKELKCWDCRMKMITDYRREHRSLKIHTNYAKMRGVKEMLK